MRDEIPEIEESKQVTGDSEPISPEDFAALKDNLYADDISGGLQNIQVPEEELEKIRAQDEEAEKHIIIQSGEHEKPYKVDGVITVFTPEELVILKEVIERYSTTNLHTLDYLDEAGVKSLYDQQAIIRQLRDTVDMNLNNYVKLRPYTPFLSSWVVKIGKDNVRKMQD